MTKSQVPPPLVLTPLWLYFALGTSQSAFFKAWIINRLTLTWNSKQIGWKSFEHPLVYLLYPELCVVTVLQVWVSLFEQCTDLLIESPNSAFFTQKVVMFPDLCGPEDVQSCSVCSHRASQSLWNILSGLCSGELSAKCLNVFWCHLKHKSLLTLKWLRGHDVLQALYSASGVIFKCVGCKVCNGSFIMASYT